MLYRRIIYSRKIHEKIRSRSGESISETLVALLIAALALVMLAGAVSAASGIITRSRTTMNNYYNANEEDTGVVKMKSVDTGHTTTVNIEEVTQSGDTMIETGIFLGEDIPVAYYENSVLPNKKVISYSKQ